ncbi:hypothetical protein TBK1r_09890 [Stieleria magnilauensis]|uniref:Uncharacterized protein n=1 Tax=Stieleria magnilauensis TaxID=2527963 RepID=A0ABX5XJA0_9BACT|nr:hypothetical protein TBK1r_09890 [Planctomycetes bacterium TBK1r]
MRSTSTGRTNRSSQRKRVTVTTATVMLAPIVTRSTSSGNAVKDLFPVFHEVLAAGRKPSGSSSLPKHRSARALPLKNPLQPCSSVLRWKRWWRVSTTVVSKHSVRRYPARMMVRRVARWSNAASSFPADSRSRSTSLRWCSLRPIQTRRRLDRHAVACTLNASDPASSRTTLYPAAPCIARGRFDRANRFAVVKSFLHFHRSRSRIGLMIRVMR